MRLKQYLWEKADIDWEQIFNDCEPYFQQLAKDNFTAFLYTGRQGAMELAFKKEVRKDRQPLDTPKWMHDLINSKFKEHFGIKARSQSLFTFPYSDGAANFGFPHYVFPIGKKFTFIYSNQINDLTRYLNLELNEKYGSMSTSLYGLLDTHGYLVWDDFKDAYVAPENTSPAKNVSNKPPVYKDEYLEDVHAVIDKAMKTYTKTKSLKNVKETSEVMVICDEVWLVRQSAIKPKKLAKEKL